MKDPKKRPPAETAAEFQRLLDASGHDQRAAANWLSRRYGGDELISDSRISRWKSGATAVPARYMDAMRELADQPADAPPAAVQLTATSEVVPLFGYANAAGAVLRLNEDQRVGVVPIHPSQRGSKAAFAFIVFGDSLSPRLRHGDVGYAIMGRMPNPGEPCVIQLKAGDVLVKIFDSADDRTLFGSQLNPPKTLTWSLANEVEHVHAVVGVTFAA